MREADCMCGCEYFAHAETGVCVRGRVECQCMQYVPKAPSITPLSWLERLIRFVIGNN